MRENKFRAWDTFTEKMVFEGFNVIGEVTCFNAIEQYGNEHPNPTYESSLMRLNDFILMQFTGLSDKNDKELYENDLLVDVYMTLYQVVWLEKDARFILSHIKGGGDAYLEIDMNPLELSLFRRVGNTFENSEWLELENG